MWYGFQKEGYRGINVVLHSIVSFNVRCGCEDSARARTKPCCDLGDYISLNNKLDNKLADVLEPSLALES